MMKYLVIGHRVVAGGEIFKESTLLDNEAIQKIGELAEFALYIMDQKPGAIRAFQKVLPGNLLSAFLIHHSTQQCLK